MNKKIALILMAAVIFLMLFAGCDKQSAGKGGISGSVGGSSGEGDDGEIAIINPLTGEVKSDGFANGMRPIAVMVNNHSKALPQSGIGSADLLYEIVTEGGITRFMAVYSDGYSFPRTGPVRSARDQYVQLMLPYSPLYVHIGSSIYAASMLDAFRYLDRDLDGKEKSEIVQFDEVRAKELDIEHCWYTSGALVEKGVQKYALYDRGEPLSVFDFLPQDAQRTPGHEAVDITIKFSSYATTRFIYNNTLQKYEKEMFGAPQTDALTDKTLAFKNLFVLFTDIGLYPDGELTEVEYNFGGVGYYFTNGGYERVRWLKGAPENPLKIVDINGNEITVKINAGNSYICFVDLLEFGNFIIG